MQYRNFGKTGYKVSALGMGCMRLPRLAGSAEGLVDREKAWEMIRYAADHGVTYYDTAYGYHNKTSEEILGEALEGGRREKVKIATKQPFGTMKDLKTGGGATIKENARRNLENTLKKLRTSYIDLYLIHGLGDSTWEGVKTEKILEEYEKFKSEGMIKGIAYSYHGEFPLFKEILEFYDWDMCQIQQNFMDVDKDTTEEAIHIAGKKGCALVIMEPLRGGLLAAPPAPVQAVYDQYPVKRSGLEWAFRHCINYPEVSTVLSGVSTLQQLKEDIEVFSKPDAVPNCLSNDDRKLLISVKEKYLSLKSIPCTACEYCMPCPHGVQIPGVFARYNDAMMYGSFESPKRSYAFMTRGKRDASLCEACGECEPKCPQSIKIIETLKMAHEALKGGVI
ncbi:MAG: aldo/keto reductase [Treponema sp.]|nr:aldo/keto reductase [Treponema sp.]